MSDYITLATAAIHAEHRRVWDPPTPRLPQLASTSAALHEVLASGVPVVASDLGALRETLRHERTGLLVPPDDQQALLSALRRLHDDPNLRATLRHGAEEH